MIFANYVIIFLFCGFKEMVKEYKEFERIYTTSRIKIVTVAHILSNARMFVCHTLFAA